MRTLLLAALAATTLLSACSSGGTSPIVTAIKDKVWPDKEEVSASTAKPSTLSRERIKASGLAAVRANIEGEDIKNVLTATSLNGQYVTYVSAFRQTVTMEGSLVTATRGLGGDLLSVRSEPNDPIARLTRLDNWPSSVVRDYRFPGNGPSGEVVSVSCSFQPGPAATLTIVELTYSVTEVKETCAGDGQKFVNTHYVDRASGQIWQSQQWVGESRGYINIETLEPYTSE